MVAVARSIRLESEIARRGIKLAPGRAERCGPCPVCGGTDRFSINVNKQVWNCRGCSTGGDVIDLVRHLDGLSFNEAVSLLTGHTPPQIPADGRQVHHGRYKNPGALAKPPEASRGTARKAAWLWGIREPITDDCPAGLYLQRTRCYGGQIPPTLGYLPANGNHPPAMIAAFGSCDEPEPGVIDPAADVTGVHIIRLLSSEQAVPVKALKITAPKSFFIRIIAPCCKNHDFYAVSRFELVKSTVLKLSDRLLHPKATRAETFQNRATRGCAELLE